MADEQPLPPRVSLLAFVSLACGIVWALGIGSLLAVVLGHLALRRIRRTGRSGRVMALAGVLLGYVGIVATVLLLLGGDVWVRPG
jgi:sorbitol-specific phosphotransferase system component IIBC